MERCDFLPFRGGAAPAAEGVVIYRLPCRAALSVRKSLRAVRIAERNRYIENTPLGSPSGTAGEWKRLFFWLQKSGVNCEKCKRFPWSGIQPLSHGVSIPKPPCQLPLHSWLSSAASGGYNEKGKLLPSASARANSRSTSG